MEPSTEYAQLGFGLISLFDSETRSFVTVSDLFNIHAGRLAGALISGIAQEAQRKIPVRMHCDNLL